MRPSGFKKTLAIMKLKVKMLLGNTAALTGPLMAVGMTVLMKVLYSSMAKDNPAVMDNLLSLALELGISMNIGMGAIMMTALPLAEDKEKYTLRSLMTSSVNGRQFFFGSVIPPFIITVIINYALILISGVNIANLDLTMFSIISIVGSLTSCMLGLLVGIVAKSQVNANNIMMPITIVLSLVPTFASINEGLSKLSSFLYTGMISDMLLSFSNNEVFKLSIIQIVILIIGVLGSSFLFMYFYKKNVVSSD